MTRGNATRPGGTIPGILYAKDYPTLDSGPFCKPRPKLDADHFVNGGGIHEMPVPEEPQPVVVVRKEPTVPASSPSSRIQQGVGSHSYKHTTANFMRLRRLAQKLDVPIGKLLDEAIEAKFAEFEERAGKITW